MTTKGQMRRLDQLEAALIDFNPKSWTLDELISALKDRTATPAQMERIWAIAGEDIRSQIVRVAKYHRLHYYGSQSLGGDLYCQPVLWAIEVLSRPADVEVEPPHPYIPTYQPERWGESASGPERRRFRLWARSFLIRKLLGDDDGLSIRIEMDQWLAGGDPLVDEDRFPHEAIYDLLLPIDGDPALMLDARMLRLPHRDLYYRITEYPCNETPESWDDPEDGQSWTPVDNRGVERL
jgi:hypothetical protein